jgi:hypothetical protein
MKLTLMIEGSPAVIAAVLAALPGGATVVTDQHELPLEVNSADIQWAIVENQPAPTNYIGEIPVAVMPAFAPGTRVAGHRYVPQDDSHIDDGAPAVDSAGNPWDARIHASSKATVSDGTWRMKRGVDRATAAEMTPMPPKLIMITSDEMEAELRGQRPVTSAPPPMPITTESAPIPMPIPVSNAPITIPEFMQRLSMQMTGADAKISNEYLTEVVGKFNAAYGTTFVTVNDFFTAPDKLPALVQMITLDGRW